MGYFEYLPNGHVCTSAGPETVSGSEPAWANYIRAAKAGVKLELSLGAGHTHQFPRRGIHESTGIRIDRTDWVVTCEKPRGRRARSGQAAASAVSDLGGRDPVGPGVGKSGRARYRRVRLGGASVGREHRKQAVVGRADGTDQGQQDREHDASRGDAREPGVASVRIRLRVGRWVLRRPRGRDAGRGCRCWHGFHGRTSTREWEEATGPAASAGIRVVNLRNRGGADRRRRVCCRGSYQSSGWDLGGGSAPGVST